MYQTVYLGLGTNLGNKKNNLKNAIKALSLELGEPVKVSSVYQSEPWGFKSPNSFLNLVVSYNTLLNAAQVLSICLDIEKQLGRKRKESLGYESRIIDIDILLFGDLLVAEDNLKIPHPWLKERLFVLEPLLEIGEKKIFNIYSSFLENLRNQEKQKIQNKLKPF